MQIIMFLEEPIRIFKFETLKEHGKVLIYIEGLTSKGETPLFQFSLEECL